MQNKGGLITTFFFFKKLLKFLSKCVDKLKKLVVLYKYRKTKEEINNGKE